MSKHMHCGCLGHAAVWTEREWSAEAAQDTPKPHELRCGVLCRRIPGWTAHCGVSKNEIIFFSFSFSLRFLLRFFRDPSPLRADVLSCEIFGNELSDLRAMY